MKRGLMLLGVSMLVAPLALHGQDAGPPPTQGDSLVFEREVFDYPRYERRNPFAPLLSAAEGGPRFERLQLMGIIHSERAERSIALFGDNSNDSGERRPNSSFRVRVGERIGNSVVLEINPRNVVLEVDEFGLTERRVIELRPRTSGQGGPR